MVFNENGLIFISDQLAVYLHGMKNDYKQNGFRVFLMTFIREKENKIQILHLWGRSFHMTAYIPGPTTMIVSHRKGNKCFQSQLFKYQTGDNTAILLSFK